MKYTQENSFYEYDILICLNSKNLFSTHPQIYYCITLWLAFFFSYYKSSLNFKTSCFKSKLIKGKKSKFNILSFLEKYSPTNSKKNFQHAVFDGKVIFFRAKLRFDLGLIYIHEIKLIRLIFVCKKKNHNWVLKYSYGRGCTSNSKKSQAQPVIKKVAKASKSGSFIKLDPLSNNNLYIRRKSGEVSKKSTDDSASDRIMDLNPSFAEENPFSDKLSHNQSRNNSEERKRVDVMGDTSNNIGNHVKSGISSSDFACISNKPRATLAPKFKNNDSLKMSSLIDLPSLEHYDSIIISES